MATALTPSPDQLLRQRKGVRFAMWLLVGRSLGLPVDEMLEAMAIQRSAAKRMRGRSPVPSSARRSCARCASSTCSPSMRPGLAR